MYEGIRPIVTKDETQNSGTFAKLVDSNRDAILRKFTEKRRAIVVLDQVFDRHLSSTASKINKGRKALALAKGQNSYNAISPADILRAFYQGDDNVKLTEAEVVNFANKIAKYLEYTSFIGLEEAREMHSVFAVSYATDPNNQWMTLDSLKPTDLAAIDEPTVDPLTLEITESIEVEVAASA